jgi:cyclopropane-fatty-acyl-phospholipid synthase
MPDTLLRPTVDEAVQATNQHYDLPPALFATYERFARSPGARQVAEDIFGFAKMVPLSTLVRTVESAGLSLTGVTDLTWHFERTVADWIERAVRERAAIDGIAPGMFVPLLQYLETTNAAWGYTTKQYALTAVRNRLGPGGSL